MDNAIRWVAREEETGDATCRDTPPVSQPVFRGSSLHDSFYQPEKPDGHARSSMGLNVMISFGKFNYLSLCCRSIFVSDSKDNPCDLDSSGHPSQGEHVWFNEAQIGDTVQCSGPFPFDSLCSGSGMTPMRRLLSPGGSE